MRAAYLHALALFELKKLDESLAMFEATAQTARAVGWRRWSAEMTRRSLPTLAEETRFPRAALVESSYHQIVPPLKAVDDEFGIIQGHVETVHAYTNDQNLIDNYHKASRRGRGAPLNMVLTETGAAKAVAKVLPQLQGKLTGNAIRVPTPNVSLAIMNLNLNEATSADELNDYIRDISLNSPLQNQIDYTASNEIVSTDLVGSRHAGVLDSQATIVDGDRAVLYVWYDNEVGYSCQVVKVMQDMSDINVPSLPAN